MATETKSRWPLIAGVAAVGTIAVIALRKSKIPSDVLAAVKLQPVPSTTGQAAIAAVSPPPFVPGEISPLKATASPISAGQQAVVTTNDPAPAGDLIIRDAPNGTQIGGADKNGIVTIINPDVTGDGIWAEIDWTGGNLPAAHGFAHRQFLKLLSVPTQAIEFPANVNASV